MDEQKRKEQATADGKKRGSLGWRIVFVVALIVFISSLVALGVIAFSYFQGQQKYSNIASTAVVENVDDKSISTLKVDWDTLLAANPDTVGWIYMPNTALNYPVVQAQDNDYYLTHDFDGDAGWLANYGAIFMDYRNNVEHWADDVYFIYGHHMNDGSMFADLAHFKDQARFDECRTFYVLTPQGNFKLRTFSLLHCGADEAVVQTTFATEEERTAYFQDKIDRSVVDPGQIPEASKIKKAFALATCDNLAANGRYVLYGYVVDTNADDLSGQVGIVLSEDGSTGFVNDLGNGNEGQPAADSANSGEQQE